MSVSSCKIFRITSSINPEVEVILQIEINRKQHPPSEAVKIAPKMNKTEYLSLRKLLLNWEKKPAKTSPLCNILLNPGIPIENNSWMLIESTKQFMTGMEQLRV